MGPAFSWLLALRYLSSRWVNLLGILGVAVAVWALIVIRSIFSGFITDIRSDVRRTSPDLLVTGLPHDTGYGQLLPALADDDVVATAPRLRHYGVFYQRTGDNAARSIEVEFSNVENSFVQLLGIDPELESEVTPLELWLERARAARPGVYPGLGAPPLGPDLQVPDAVEWNARRNLGLPVPASPEEHRAAWPGLLLGSERARWLYRLQVGDPLDVVSADFAEPGEGGSGRVQPISVPFAFAGTFLTGAKLFDETTALVPIETLRTMLGHHPLDFGSIDLVTDVAISARPGLGGHQLEALAARLLPAVRAAVAASAGPAAAAGAEVLTWEQQNVVFLDAVEHERAMMTLVLFAVMLVAAFLIYATLHMMVTQKVKDIGILSALGGAPSGVGAIFTRCGTVIGVLGCALGVVAGVLSLHWLNPVNDWLSRQFGVELFPATMFDLPQIPYVIDPGWLAGIPIAALGLTLVVSWLPARKAARMPPVKALSYE